LFRPWDASWGLDATPPKYEPLIPGLPLGETFMIPRADFPPEAKAAFDLYVAILERLRKENPGVKFVVATGRDQSACHRSGSCDGTFTFADGRTVRKGVAQLLANSDWLCERANVHCLHPAIPAKAPEPDELLTYINDGHYSIRGHQWLAQSFAEGLTKILAKK
jgi:hypothetical protein